MGLDVDLDFDKHCRIGLSPKTVLPSNRHRSSVENRSRRSKLKQRDEVLSIQGDYTEISLGHYRSASCKSIPSRPVGLGGNVELKRGSVYESSREVRKMKKMESLPGRSKIEISCCSDTSFSFGLVDSVCSSDEESPKKRSSAISCKPAAEPYSSDGFLEIHLNSDNRGKSCAKTVERDSTEDPNMKSQQVLSPRNDGNELLERDTRALHKSISAKVEMPYSPSQSEYVRARASQKSRFSPIRKMLNPFTKSKSQRSPLGYAMECGEVKTNGMADIKKNCTLRKSLLSNTEQNLESESYFVKKDNIPPVVPCSPAHLHGCLKLDNKHGVPFFEFSLKCPEDVYVAKTWKVDNALNWVYTFHSRKRNNAIGRASKDGNKESLMMGQMQVSCYICSEQKDGVFNNSVATDFVLYDIAHARKSVSSQESSISSPDSSKPRKGSHGGSVKETLELECVSDLVKLKHQTLYPWPPADLHPDLEIAAIVIQVPIEKRESLKYKRGEKISNNGVTEFLEYCLDQRKKEIPQNRSPVKMNVVTPSGIHGLPNAESEGPSSLLDRWRMGGGCDCGGWDMACPLTVFCDSSYLCAGDHSLAKDQQPLELYVQGGKESTPALSITVVKEGQYAVDFHACLSTLQAFAICVAILHSSEASTAVRQEGLKQLQCNSLKVLVEEEVDFFIEAVTAEEKRKVATVRKEIPPSFVLNPPFSPIARV